jgi:hypothetical protein
LAFVFVIITFSVGDWVVHFAATATTTTTIKMTRVSLTVLYQDGKDDNKGWRQHEDDGEGKCSGISTKKKAQSQPLMI